MTRQGGSAPPSGVDAVWGEIEAVIEAVTGHRPTLLGQRPLAGGASMETWALDLGLGPEGQARTPLVLRRDMGANMNPLALTRVQEFRLIERARATGVRCPQPRFHSGEREGRQWFLMERCPGESVGRRVVRAPELAAARDGLAYTMGAQLARIHRLPVDASLDFLPRPATGQSPAAWALEGTRATLHGLRRDNPVWAYALRWLTHHAPEDDGVRAVLHGDYRIGNLLVTPEGLSAIIDWEFAHIGDPHEDLAWPTLRDWRFEQDGLPVGGVGSLERFLAGYRDEGCPPVDLGRMRWWALLGNLRWSITCHVQAERHLSGRDRSVEFASLGRKSAEIDWEIVNLLDQEERSRR
jgi:aminoglycoside phosphotransferase (APT) family kinase protein